MKFLFGPNVTTGTIVFLVAAGAEVPFLRPIEISQDESLDLEWMTHVLEFLKKEDGELPDLMVHLRPT